jgi:hypothetical protein
VKITGIPVILLITMQGAVMIKLAFIVKKLKNKLMKLIFTLFMIIVGLNQSYSQAGKLKQSFGDTGKVLTGYNNAQLTCFASAIQNDNKTVAVGNYDSIGIDGFLILRYSATGN